MKYRHELKFEINYSDILVLRQRLGAVAAADSHCVGGRYVVRSLYFDSFDDAALREKLDGVSRREKFRLRCYNADLSFIALEKKIKCAGLCGKRSQQITAETAAKIAGGDCGALKSLDGELAAELYAKTVSGLLRPKTVVEYTREPFVFAPGNVRVTIDYDIRTALHLTDFLSPELISVPVGGQAAILEVKWDEFLPDIIRDAVNIDGRRVGAFSKYAACRMYD